MPRVSVWTHDRISIDGRQGELLTADEARTLAHELLRAADRTDPTKKVAPKLTITIGDKSKPQTEFHFLGGSLILSACGLRVLQDHISCTNDVTKVTCPKCKETNRYRDQVKV